MESKVNKQIEGRITMALRTLMLKKKIDETRKALETAMSKRTELETQEAELEQSIAEAETEEEKAAVEEAVAAFEEEKKANDENVESLRTVLEGLENDLAEEEQNQTPTPKADDSDNNTRSREEIKKMPTRTKFYGMTIEERNAFFENDEVKSFLARAREIGKEKRAVAGGELLIPTVVLSLIRENITQYSKLITKVNKQSVPGKARQNIMGLVPEAVWTEMCAKLNELNLDFAGVEMDGYKVGGFVPVCNATLEDSDENLATIIIEAIGKAIGYALDKAIVFGTGVKMPKGIFTRLAETSDPSDSRTTIPWKDLHTSNILKIAASTTGVKFFQEFLKDSAAAKSDYAKNGKFWVMNETTKTAVMAEGIGINAAGAIVSGVNNEMPVVGGEIVVLNFMPDNVIVGGYGELYVLAERAGAEFAQSEHVRFIEDQTVFKGTARYEASLPCGTRPQPESSDRTALRPAVAQYCRRGADIKHYRCQD